MGSEEAVAVSGTPVADKLQLLSTLLTGEERSIMDEYPEGR